MLDRNQRGSILGILLTAILIFILVSMFYKSQTDDNTGENGNSEASLIEQTQDTVNNANDAGQKANSILKGLTGQ